MTTKKQKLKDTVKKMSKKTKPKTDKAALKNLLLKDVNDKKEVERLERIKANKNIEEITVWTHNTTPLCKEIIDKLTSEGISFIEKDAEKLQEEFNNVVLVTNQMSVPQIIVKGEHLVNTRDFKTSDQLIQIITRIGKQGVIIPPTDIRTLEAFKNMASGFSQQLQTVHQTLGQINQKLGPIQQFIDKLKEEIESEDA